MMGKYRYFIAATAGIASGCLIPNDLPASGKPNIIFILADDMGYGDLSCFNEESKIHTPHLDRLASEGIRFTDAHTSSAVCTPTRYSILTGRYNWRSEQKKGVLSGYSKALIEPGRMTVGKLLQETGYQTAFIGKWHLGWDWHIASPSDWQSGPLGSGPDPEVDFGKPILNGPNERGFTYSYGFSGSLDMPPYVYVENNMATAIPRDSTQSLDEKGYWRIGITAPDFIHAEVLPHLTEKALQYIREQSETAQPFFLYFALPAPHTPILPTSEFIGRSNTNFYGDFVMQVDDVVGKIMDELALRGASENTMFIFSSDNGCSPKANFEELKKAGHHPSYIFRGQKADIFEGGHRVPFIVRWPSKIKSEMVSDHLICTTDLMATVADMFNYTLPDNAGEDSFSFLPILTGGNLMAPLRESIVHHSLHGRFAIRRGDWKLILWRGSGGYQDRPPQDLPMYQLYNLKNDPAETANRIADFPDIAEELKKLLTTYILSGRSTPGKPLETIGLDNWPEIGWMNYSGNNR